MARNTGKEAYLERRTVDQPVRWLSAKATARWLTILFCLAVWAALIVFFLL